MERTFRIDLISDTSTRPTPAMRRAMAEAEVGDEQRGEDPSVNRLCDRAAALMGQEAALFLPSGTMCNQIALAVHCRPGDEVICERTSHIVNFEVGGAAAIAGAMINAIDGTRGMFDAGQLTSALRPALRHTPKARLVAVEQTSNLGGGSVWPLITTPSGVSAIMSPGRAIRRLT